MAQEDLEIEEDLCAYVYEMVEELKDQLADVLSVRPLPAAPPPPRPPPRLRGPGASLVPSPCGAQEKENIKLEMAEVEQRMRAIDGINLGFMNIFGGSASDKPKLAQDKKELQEEKDNNDRLEIVLG